MWNIVIWLLLCEIAAILATLSVQHTTMHQFTVSLHSKPRTWGACEFSCNLPPALLAEWLGSFMCCCNETGVEQMLKWESAKMIWWPFNHGSGALPLRDSGDCPCLLVQEDLIDFCVTADQLITLWTDSNGETIARAALLTEWVVTLMKGTGTTHLCLLLQCKRTEYHTTETAADVYLLKSACNCCWCLTCKYCWCLTCNCWWCLTCNCCWCLTCNCWWCLTCNCCWRLFASVNKSACSYCWCFVICFGQQVSKQLLLMFIFLQSASQHATAADVSMQLLLVFWYLLRSASDWSWQKCAWGGQH